MKKMFTKLVVAAMLVLPGLASAEDEINPFARYDEFFFTLTGVSNFSVNTSWSDLLQPETDPLLKYYLDIEVPATEEDGAYFEGVDSGEITGVDPIGGEHTLSFNNLAAGNYSLYLYGLWDGVGNTNGLNGMVDIANSGTVTAVPEPETYAMLLAGLMLMGTIARRRSNTK